MKPLARWLVAGGVLIAAAPVAGATVDVRPAPATNVLSATRLLELAARADDEISYQGTQFVMLWGESGATSAVVEVSHTAGEDTVFRLTPTPDTPQGAVLRASGGESALLGAAGTLNLLARNFSARLERADSVAGRPTQVVAVARQGASPVARFWLDAVTHLVLRREVLDRDGRVLRTTAFVNVAIGERTDSLPHAPSLDLPRPTGVALTPQEATSLGDDGWTVPADFGEGVELFDARMAGDVGSEVLHLSYSDGVSTVSVFQQPGELDHHALDGYVKADVGGSKVWTSSSFPRRVVWAAGGKVFTVIAECPQQTLDAVVGALPRPSNGGFLTRVGRGLTRVGGWLNPFS